jgi:hypothetical protein
VPGYAYIPAATTVAQDSTPALSVAKEKTFYGFKVNHSTGRLTVEQITPESGDVIKIPQADVIDATDYKHWVWNENTLNFTWSSDNLLVEVK